MTIIQRLKTSKLARWLRKYRQHEKIQYVAHPIYFSPSIIPEYILKQSDLCTACKNGCEIIKCKVTRSGCSKCKKEFKLGIFSGKR
jgi:hypothetical protein